MQGRIGRNFPAFVAVAVGCALRRTRPFKTNDSHILLASIPNSRTRRTRTTNNGRENQEGYGKQVNEYREGMEYYNSMIQSYKNVITHNPATPLRIL